VRRELHEAEIVVHARRVTMSRASSVACSMSLSAPVVRRGEHDDAFAAREAVHLG
jgi:hypothetical protein